ncbi:MAG TPA: serine/threonine-protein kinase [Myxococcaceae bacterium]|nr:serine/threonine-protein kinase [Myxococcaceae bacterium]
MVAIQTTPDSMPDADEMIGRQLGSFRLVRRLGTGGMGSVYLARHVVIGSRVAVKVLHPALHCDAQMLERFQDEARAVNLIGHDNILRIYDLRREGDLHYLVMEYLEGQPLSQVPLPMDAETAIPILAQLCDALAAAHAQGVVHRDVKPENVMLVQRRGGDPFVKLLDFGIAKLLQDATSRTAAGFVVGTPAYMAPESFRGEPLDGRADLYALGMISYLMATGELPFRDKPMAALMRAHLEAVPVPPASLRPGVDPRWSEITVRAMAKRPEDRYQDAAALRDDLLSVLGSRSAAPAPVPPPAPRPSRPSLEVEVVGEDGRVLRTAAGMELSMEGMFLAAPDFAPRLFSPLKLTIRGPGGGALRMDAEAVRPVNAAQAAAWGMSEGVGVQFVRVTEEQRRGLSALALGAPLPSETPPQLDVKDGPAPETVLALLQRQAQQAGGDPYRLLGVALDADAFTVRSRARELRVALQGCRPPRATAQQHREAEALLDQVARAAQTLVDPPRRAELDAAHGNVAGVERAIAEGLTMTELEQLHRRFLQDCPRQAAHAALEAAAGRAYERASDLRAAAAAFERAQQHDPLDQELRRRVQDLRRRVSGQAEEAGETVSLRRSPV